jgi:hypothetical protein
MRRLVALAPLCLAFALSGAAAQSPPTAADFLFDHPQWAAAAPGVALTYRYTRSSPMEAVFGPNVEDRIRLVTETGTAPVNRTVRVEMFSDSRRRAAGPFEDVPGNPVLVLFLEHHLENLARVLKANPRYLKNGIRAGLRDRATVTATTIDFGGRPVDGWRIEAKPFLDDPNKAKMRGLETLAYTFVAADGVPGSVASIEAKAVGSDGNTLLTETLAYVPEAR